MNIGILSIRKKTITLTMTILLIGGGLISYEQMGRLEDPEFTIKEALIITAYPGATPEEVEEEVTDVIEQACQQLGQLKRIKNSKSTRGLSIVQVEIKNTYDKYTLPQVWDELRRKIEDAQRNLPPGAEPSIVYDDFGDVYGVFIAFTGEGYLYADLEDAVDFLKRELLLVPDVKKIELYGVQPEAVYVEMSREKMAQLGITQEDIYRSLSHKTLAADAGHFTVGDEYIPLDPTGTFTSEQEFGDLLISPEGSDRIVYLKDVADIRRGYVEPSSNILRFDGKPAVGLGISTVLGGNVVRMGEALEKRFEELKPLLPAGIEGHIIYLQSEQVTKAINGFIINLLEAIAIVIIVLLIFMGVRSGLIIGFILFLTIAGTFVVMKAHGDIMLERISLGALIIALGMLVDNAIVITDGILVKIQQGAERIKSAGEVVQQNMMPLLGATAIAVLAFGAIGLSQDSTGEYCRSLFYVLLISLTMSWLTAVTVTPLLCVMFLKATPSSGNGKDPYAGGFYRKYRGLLLLCLRKRSATIVGAFGLLLIAVLCFGFVEKMFFPPSTTPQFLIDIWLPEGTDIEETARETHEVEKHLMGMKHVEHVASFIGQGGLRFMLTYTPEKNYSSYAQLMVTVDDVANIGKMYPDIYKFLWDNLPDADVLLMRFVLGPGEPGKIRARFSGPDPAVLRELADKAMAVFRKAPDAALVRSDWRQRVKVIRPVLAEAQARRAGITRADVARALQAAYDGTRAGVYREGRKVMPVIARAPEKERTNVDNLYDLQIWSPTAKRMIPLRQVVSNFEVVSEDPIIMRRDRRRTIEARCDPRYGLASELQTRVQPEIEAIKLPPGYSFEWGGEYEDTRKAQAPIKASMPFFILLMVLICVVLFNSLKTPLVIWLAVPLACIGVSLGLLLTRQPFGFMALLGTLALIGMLIKNSIVLIDRINSNIGEGREPFDSIVEAGVSRMRPVMMAASTTVLGMAPLLQDRFFVSMAVAIMFGLGFATVLSLLVVPVLFAIFYRIPYKGSQIVHPESQSRYEKRGESHEKD
jgi:multidrug efflux pump subunit AcrB